MVLSFLELEIEGLQNIVTISIPLTIRSISKIIFKKLAAFAPGVLIGIGAALYFLLFSDHFDRSLTYAARLLALNGQMVAPIPINTPGAKAASRYNFQAFRTFNFKNSPPLSCVNRFTIRVVRAGRNMNIIDVKIIRGLAGSACNKKSGRVHRITMVFYGELLTLR